VARKKASFCRSKRETERKGEGMMDGLVREKCLVDGQMGRYLRGRRNSEKKAKNSTNKEKKHGHLLL